jgi:hypothetical protein
MFALLSGDSDFTPLVSKLKENDKRVIGCGVKSSTSDLLLGSCDEFIYYDDLIRAAPAPRKSRRGETPDSERKREATRQLLEIVHSLERDYDNVWGSMVKQTIRRVYPGFNEEYYGHPSFSALLESAQEDGHLELEYDPDRGNYKVRLKRAADSR